MWSLHFHSPVLSENKCHFKRKPFRKNIYRYDTNIFLLSMSFFNFRTRRFYYFLFTIFISLFSALKLLLHPPNMFRLCLKSSTYNLESMMQHFPLVFLISLLYHFKLLKLFFRWVFVRKIKMFFKNFFAINHDWR